MGDRVLRVSSLSEYKDVVNDYSTIVKFTASWCGPCRKMAPIFDELANNSPEGIIFLEVDIEKCKDISSEMQIMGIPAFIFYRDGEIQPDFTVIGGDPQSLRQNVNIFCNIQETNRQTVQSVNNTKDHEVLETREQSKTREQKRNSRDLDQEYPIIIDTSALFRKEENLTSGDDSFDDIVALDRLHLDEHPSDENSIDTSSSEEDLENDIEKDSIPIDFGINMTKAEIFALAMRSKKSE